MRFHACCAWPEVLRSFWIRCRVGCHRIGGVCLAPSKVLLDYPCLVAMDQIESLGVARTLSLAITALCACWPGFVTLVLLSVMRVNQKRDNDNRKPRYEDTTRDDWD